MDLIVSLLDYEFNAQLNRAVPTSSSEKYHKCLNIIIFLILRLNMFEIMEEYLRRDLIKFMLLLSSLKA
uniref:Uncharacterized protein n=1 Tax=Lepeophtheirus salmonis TaxID=72036 RepID=A0A0K2TNU7_LEPSM